MIDETNPVWIELQKVWELLQRPIFSINNSKISFTSIVASLLVITLAILAAKYIGRMINRTLSDKHVDTGVRDSIEKFFRYIVIAVGILFALDNLGISISSLAGVGAILMVGIGFGLQNITQNFISGIILLIERPIKVGDIIKVGESSGKVMDIRVRSSIIRTRDEVTIIIPNSKFLSEEVISDSYSSQKIRQHINVRVAYGTDLELVKKLLCEAASSHEEVLAQPAPRALLLNFGDTALEFDIRFWCQNIWQIDIISSDIRVTIERLFRENKVSIPFPRTDIYTHRVDPTPTL